MTLDFTAFLDPLVLQDTPRLFTAIAEWLAVLVYIGIYKKRYTGKILIWQSLAILVIMVIYQFIAGLLSLWLWIPSMIGAVTLMYFSLYLILDIKSKDCGVLTAHAFVLAEFAASFYTQMYVWFVYLVGEEFDTILHSTVIMIILFILVYSVYYYVERGHILPNRNLNITNRELLSVLATGVGAFIMSNISFVDSRTPFSATENLLYVRTLVDFGGMLMLMTQMGRRNEMAAKNESDAINQLFKRQYEQYRLAIDNSEALRKEIHDMKHYVIALKNEDDPVKRAEVLNDMEQAIAIQESFMNTGNKVLDVILTTKSLQCEKNGITLNAMVDGDILSDIHVKDICSLFGNILDNAIEASRQVEDKNKRLISLSVRKRNQFIVVECENYSHSDNVRLKNENNKRIFGKNSMPATTKKDNVKHGFGLKSIGQVAEKYGGAMNCSYDEGWFKVKLLLTSNK